MHCDYNGWNDAPEEEREWFDQHPEIWEATRLEAILRPPRVTRHTPIEHRGLAA